MSKTKPKSKPPADAYFSSPEYLRYVEDRRKARADYEAGYIPENKSARAIDPSYHLESLRKRREKVVESLKTSEDQQRIADIDERDSIDDTIKQLNAGMQWVSSYMRGKNKVSGYWRKKNSFSQPKYGLGLPNTAGTGTIR